MGRLYWKFFAFFFLAQLTAVMGVGISVWVANKNLDRENAQLEASPPAKSMIDAASVTLKFGGVDSLRGLMKHWEQRKIPQVYAVNESNVEVQNRKLPIEVVQSARDAMQRMIANSPAPNPASSGNLISRSPVQLVEASDGHQYLLFVPALKYQDASVLPPVDKQPGMLGYSPRQKNRHLFPLMPLLAGVLASLIFAALLAWYFSKPIKKLREAFDSAANGNLDVRVSDAMGERRDELADLGQAFDLMASRLGTLMLSQTRLLHQVSHELRSPLARLQIAVGLARQQPEKSEVSLIRIERESERMDKLVGELLELSRLESGVMNIDKEVIDINELLLTIAEDARFEGMAKRIMIEYVPTATVSVFGQQELLHRAIDNVVRNALKYSPEQSIIHINEVMTGSQVVIRVMDSGPGVVDAELDTIFQAFFRGSNTHHADGHGVGLAIAKQIIEAHGGSIKAYNRGEGGLAVEIHLPVKA
ncbi:MAG TPA: ATP-binding protein [Methylotenera sp.]|nr:ATP-binding protein [Methylotenera sp.]